MNHLLQAALRKRLPLRKVTNALRLVNGRGDGLPGLVLEQYDRHFAAQVFDAAWLGRAEMLTDLIKSNFKPEYFILKDRSHSSAAVPDAIRTQVLIDDAGPGTIVEEYGLKFAVDLDDGLNTGLFLDMRANRHRIGKMAKAKRVLNCFAYTCSFGVHAAANGARAVVNVDISKKTLERGLENYKLNGLSPPGTEFIRADAAAYLKRAAKKQNRFDLIIVDPPSFARGGGGVFQIKKDLPRVLADAVLALEPGGAVFIATNFNGLDHAALERMVKHAAAGRGIKNMERAGQDLDFPGTNTFKESYLAAITARIL